MKIVNYLPLFLLFVLVLPASAQNRERPPAPCTTCVQKVYAVADLIVPLNAPDKSARDNAAHLIKLAQMANPETWEALGGCGTAEYYPNSHALVVSQTPEVQERIAAMLESLRKAQDTQVTMEICFVRTSQAMRERMRSELPVRVVPQVIREVDSAGVERVGVRFDKPTASPQKSVIWTDKQVHMFLEMVQGDRRSNIMQAPKLTTVNGQTAMMEVGSVYPITTIKVEECKGRKLCVPVTESVFVGVRCEAVGVVKETSGSVMLRFKAHITEPLATPTSGSVIFNPTPATRIQSIAVDRTATIPNGCTLVLPAGTFLREDGVENATSAVLSKVPYLNRLFRNVGYGMTSDDVVVLVRPRIGVGEVQVPACLKEMTNIRCCGSAIAGIPAAPVASVQGGCALIVPPVTAEKCASPNSSCCEPKASAMNLADVVALSSSGVSDELIINQMHTTGASFILSTEDILWLKKNKVSDKVVMEMQNSRMRVPAPLATAPTHPTVQYTPAAPTPAFPPTMPYIQRIDSLTPPLPTPGSLRPMMPGLVPSAPRSSNSAAPVPQAREAGEIGQQIVEAATWMVDGIATLVGEELPEMLTEAGATVRPKVKVRVELKFGNNEPVGPR